MAIDKNDMVMKEDELGLVDFECYFENNFEDCLDKYVESINAEKIKEISNNLNQQIATKVFVEYIHHNLKDRVAIEFFENIIFKNLNIILYNIMNVIENNLFSFFTKEVKELFMSKFSEYLRFMGKVKFSLIRLENNFSLYEKKAYDRYIELEKKYGIDNDKFHDKLDEDEDYNVFSSKQIEIRHRLDTLGDMVNCPSRELDDYFFFDERDVEFHYNINNNNNNKNNINNKIERLARETSKQIYELYFNITRFEFDNYINLIQFINGFSDLNPETVGIIISEIENIAKNNGVDLTTKVTHRKI